MPAGPLEDLVGEMMLSLHTSARRHGLTLVQLIALKLVDREGSIAPSVLAELLGVSRPAATSSLNILESGGWIVRSRLAEDRRTLRAELTPRARRLLAQVAQDRRSLLEDGLSTMDRADRAQLARLVDRMVRALRELRSTEGNLRRRTGCR